MKKPLREVLKDFAIIYASTALTVLLLNVIIELGLEIEWVVFYPAAIIISTVAIFVFDATIPNRYKIYGSIIVAINSLVIMYSWTEFGPIKFILYGLIFGAPLLLIIGKLLYKHLTKRYYFNDEI